MGLLQARLDLLKKDLQVTALRTTRWSCTVLTWQLIDSPVSGGSVRAGTGTLAVMSSGQPAAITKAQAMMQLVSREPEGKLTIVGNKLGIASNFKLINQVYCAIHICITG